MPKFFEYDDPNMAAHVAKIVELAADAEMNESVCVSDKTIYANNNLEKPFAPITAEDVKHRYELGQGGGRDKFTVAEHRVEQQEFVDRYESLQADRDAGGNFHVSAAQTAKVARVVQEQENKKQEEMGYLKRIKAAISLSGEARMKRADAKMLKKSIEKAIKSAESE
jgi:hypothetical protein